MSVCMFLTVVGIGGRWMDVQRGQVIACIYNFRKVRSHKPPSTVLKLDFFLPSTLRARIVLRDAKNSIVYA